MPLGCGRPPYSCRRPAAPATRGRPGFRWPSPWMPWWTPRSARVGARLRAHTPSQPGATTGPAGIGQDGLVEFDWRLAVGGQSLTDAEVNDLVAAQQPLVRVRGQWVAVDSERLARARAFVQRGRRGATSRASAVELLGMVAGGAEGPGGLPLVG